MAKYDVNLLEETLKIKVRDDYFPKFKMGQIGKIDFVISKTKEIYEASCICVGKT